MKCQHGQNLRVVYCKWAYLSHIIEIDNCNKIDELAEEEEYLEEDEENEEEMTEEEIEEEEIYEEDLEEESIVEEIVEEESEEKADTEENPILPEKEDKITQFNRPFEEVLLYKGVNVVWYGRQESYLSADETEEEEEVPIEEDLIKLRKSSVSKTERRKSDNKKVKGEKLSKLAKSAKQSNKKSQSKKGLKANVDETKDPNADISDESENEKISKDKKSTAASNDKKIVVAADVNNDNGEQEIAEYEESAPFNVFELPDIKELMRRVDVESQSKLKVEFDKLASEGKMIIQPWKKNDTSIIDIDSLFIHDKVILTGSWYAKLIRYDKIDIRERNRKINILNKGLLRIRTQCEKRFIKRMDALNINKWKTSFSAICDTDEKEKTRECQEISVVRSQHKIYKETVDKDETLPSWRKRIYKGTSRVTTLGEESDILWDKHFVGDNKGDLVSVSEGDSTKIDDDYDNDYDDEYDNKKKKELCKKISRKFVKYLHTFCKDNRRKLKQEKIDQTKNDDSESVCSDTLEESEEFEGNNESKLETSYEGKEGKDKGEDHESEGNRPNDECYHPDEGSDDDENIDTSEDYDKEDEEKESDKDNCDDQTSEECICYGDYPDRELIETCLTLVGTAELKDDKDTYSCRIIEEID